MYGWACSILYNCFTNGCELCVSLLRGLFKIFFFCERSLSVRASEASTTNGCVRKRTDLSLIYRFFMNVVFRQYPSMPSRFRSATQKWMTLHSQFTILWGLYASSTNCTCNQIWNISNLAWNITTSKTFVMTEILKATQLFERSLFCGIYNALKCVKWTW